MSTFVMSATDTSLVFSIFNGHPRKSEVTILGAIRTFHCFIIILSRKYSRSCKNSFLSYIVSNILKCLKRSDHVCETEIEGDTYLKFNFRFINTFTLLKLQLLKLNCMGFCVNIDLIWIKNNYFFLKRSREKTC